MNIRGVATLNMASSDPGIETDKRSLLDSILEKVILSDKIIKTQQRDEPDLTKSEKIAILTELIQRLPGSFLMRFGAVLDEEHLTYFNYCQDHEVQYRLKELRTPQPSSFRNRRYRAIKVLTSTTSYFDEDSMKERYPDLYEHYIGQYLTKEQKQAMIKNKQDKITLLSEILQYNYSNSMHMKKTVKSMSLSDDPCKAEEEKEMLRKEFLKAVHVSFINGEDEEFDYSTVDDNPDYDDMEIINNDIEESYFDSEEPSFIETHVEKINSDANR